MKTIIFVTGNANKLCEVKQIIGDSVIVESRNIDRAYCIFFLFSVWYTDISFVFQSDAVPELQGDPHDIVHEKCKMAIGMLCHLEPTLSSDTMIVVEDTSLCFHALNGMPGPYVKWFKDKIGLGGLNNLLCANDDKSAHASCVLGYGSPIALDSIQTLEGTVLGKIVPPRGPLSFGWDSIFVPSGYDLTFAELDSVVKNAMSHRKKAFELFKSRI